MDKEPLAPDILLNDVKQLIDETPQRIAVAVNAELSMLYRKVVKRINDDVLKGKRAGYGKEVLVTLSPAPTLQYGMGWSKPQPRQCLRFALVFSDKRIAYAIYLL